MVEVELAEATTPLEAVDSLQMRQDLECRRTWSASVVARPRTFATQLRSSSPAPGGTSAPASPSGFSLAPTSPRSPLTSSSLHLGLQDFTPMLQCEAKVRKKQRLANGTKLT